MYSVTNFTFIEEDNINKTHFQKSEFSNLQGLFALVSCISEFYLSYGSIYNPFNKYDLIDIEDRKFELVRMPLGSSRGRVKEIFKKQEPLKKKLIFIAIKASYFVTFGILPLIAAIFAIINRIIHKPHFLPKVSDNRIIEIYNALQKIDKEPLNKPQITPISIEEVKPKSEVIQNFHKLKLKELEKKDVDKMRRILGTSTFSKIKTLNLNSTDLTDEDSWKKNVPGIPKDYLLRQICLMFPNLEKLTIEMSINDALSYLYNVKDICPKLQITNLLYGEE